MSEEQQPLQNTDKVIHREKHSDHWGAFDDTLFVTDRGGIGIDVAGMVYVRPLKEWHALESRIAFLESQVKVAVEALDLIETVGNDAEHMQGIASVALNTLRDGGKAAGR
jgi:hypothetical protein